MDGHRRLVLVRNCRMRRVVTLVDLAIRLAAVSSVRIVNLFIADKSEGSRVAGNEAVALKRQRPFAG